MIDSPRDRTPVWPGGPALWLWAAPLLMTCGNFGLLLVVALPSSPAALRDVDRWLGDRKQDLGGGLFGDAVLMAALTASAALPGVAYLLRRDGATPRGWRNAALYAAAAWAATTAVALGLLAVARSVF